MALVPGRTTCPGVLAQTTALGALLVFDLAGLETARGSTGGLSTPAVAMRSC
jgi:hypothetical protein